MGKSPKKKTSKVPVPHQQEIVSIYTRMGDLSKEELIYIKQQLQQQQPQTKNRNKSQPANKKCFPEQMQSQNKLYVIGQCNSNDKMQYTNKDHQMDSVSIYLQQSGANKKRKLTKQRQRRNMDLADVCNDTTINTHHNRTTEEDAQQQFDRNSINAIEEEETQKTEEEVGHKASSDLESSILQQTHQLHESGLKLMSESSDVNEKNQRGGNQTPISTNTANLYLTQSSNYNSAVPVQNERYTKPKQSAPNSLRKSARMVPAPAQIQAQNLKGNVKDQNQQLYSLIEKSQRNQNPQSKSIEGMQAQFAHNIQQTSGKQSQSPRAKDTHRMVLQKVGINVGKMDVIQTLIDQHKQPLHIQDHATEPEIVNNKYDNNQDSRFSIVRQEITIKGEEIDEKIDNQYQDMNHQSDNELENTQFLLNYVPAKPTLDNSPKKTTYNTADSDKKSDCIQIADDPYNDNEAPKQQKQPKSTKNKENFQFQQQLQLQQQMTQQCFNVPQTVKQAKAKIIKKAKVDAVTAQVISVEPHLKRCMQRLGWIESVGTGNFHIRFDITDKESNQGKMRPLQWYNHFPNNRELVTKAGLCKNLWQQCYQDYELKVAEFFPRCYDLSDQKQIDQFFQDFQMTAILNIIKQYASHFMKKTRNIHKYLDEYKTKDTYNLNRIFKQKFKFKCSQYDQQMSGVGNLLGNDSLRLAMQYAKVNIIRKQAIDAKKYNRKFSEEEIQILIDFSQQLLEKGIQNQKFPIYEQIKTIQVHEQLTQIVPQYATIDGLANVWVVKPSYNARGLGVYCSNKLKEICQQGKKSQSKIVQKYIENPYLLNRKKFDIRQWVLVTSWEPLDVYIFSGAYLKICGNEFDLTNLADQFSHLSNFSIQKNNKQTTNDDLVMSNDQFEQHLRSNGHATFSWTKDMYPKIQQAIYKTFKGVQESLEQRPNTFEIYGFDLILDEKLDPWVIEVNLSPACNERTDWLIKMLDDMSMDLLYYVENKIISQNDSEWESNYKDRKKVAAVNTTLYLNDEVFYEEQEIKYRWTRINECLTEIKNHQISTQLMNQMLQNKISQLEILGNKVDLRAEKRIDKNYQKSQAAQLIQRVYLGFKGRQVYKQLLHNKSSLLIQRYLRKQIAINKVKLMIKNKSSILIQRYMRKQLALFQVKRIIAEKIHQAKLLVAIKLQAHFRRKKAYCSFTVLRQNAKSKIIQAKLRQRLAKHKVRKLMSYKVKVIYIQRFYKRRYKQKKLMAILLQKYLKGIISRSLVINKLRVSRASHLLKILSDRKKQQSAFLWMKLNSISVTLQSLYRKKRCQIKYKLQLTNQAQEELKLLFREWLLKQVKCLALDYKLKMNQKAVAIQKFLKGYNSFKKVKRAYNLKIKNKKAVYIQKYLRKILAINLVAFRKDFLKQVIKIQSFNRQILAKKHFQKLKSQKKLLENRKKKDLEKKFVKNKKVESEIENYIESLFQKEINPRTIKQNFTSQTPLSGKRKHGASNTNLVRQSMTSQTQIRESTANAQTYMDPTTVGSDHPQTMQEQSIINQDFDQEAILAASMIDDNSPIDIQTSTQDRQQKSLRIRKSQKGQSGQQIMTNFVQNKGSKVTYQKELNNKIQGAITKVKTSTNTQRQQSVTKQTAKQPQQLVKPKTFAENLMNMLAMQNIGQVFSENPVEALAVLKDQQPTSKDGSIAGKRRNSVVSRGDAQNQSFINTSKNQVAQSEKNTIEPKPVQFPKLTEFKSATNNIYLAQRPVADPRQESEFQQALMEQKLKAQQMNTSTFLQSSYSRTEIQTGAHSTQDKHRISSESLRKVDQQPTNIEENLLQRPGAREPNVMVLQAYKKQSPFNPFDHFKKPNKKRGESVGSRGKVKYIESKMPTELPSSGTTLTKKSTSEMPPIMESTTKLVII